jgi:uncharacterized protein YndB with AHSA1/START domain
VTSRVIVAVRVAASPERAFEAFTGDIAAWWRPNMLFAFTPRDPGKLAFEPGEDGRLVEILPSGQVFEIGKVKVWSPPRRLVFGWRQASFAPDQATEVEVRFEAVGAETRVTVEHSGWDSVPAAHAARHGFPETVFLTRHAQWWQSLLAGYKAAVGEGGLDDR